MGYTWDPEKRLSNIEKHGIDFVDVPPVFDAPMLTLLDTKADYGEDRWIGIGIIQGIEIVVVYTEDEEADEIRIISARKATLSEREKYHERV